MKQLTFDDCTPDWPAPEPARQRPAGTRYWLRMNNDFWGQHLPVGRYRIVTIPITGKYGEYL